MIQAQVDLKKGSQSFAFAAWIFPKKLYQDVATLYAWCRRCDDIADGSSLGWGQQKTQPLNAHRLKQFREQTWTAYQQELSCDRSRAISLDAKECIDPYCQSFAKLMYQYQIPWKYVEDLFQGMETDVQGIHFFNFEQLQMYAYQVAGTVGCMMCYLMRVHHEHALQKAIDLGIALQLTNIARDLMDDVRVGKVYLPETWLKTLRKNQHSWTQESFVIQSLCERLVLQAECFYQSGLSGLRYLPARFSLAVSIAAWVYRQIGIELLKGRYLKCSLKRDRFSLSSFQRGIAFLKGVFYWIKRGMRE